VGQTDANRIRRGAKREFDPKSGRRRKRKLYSERSCRQNFDEVVFSSLIKNLTSMSSFNPTQIFQDDVTEEKGENARLSAFVGAIAVGDLVKSTLGPKGMDKILQSA
jgi:hypothetical protein